MSEMKHTKGPWVQGEGDPEHILSASTFECVATVNPILGDREANASLIAAAPDLLAVIRYAVDNPDFKSDVFDQMARAAIAKAQGHAHD